MEGGIHALKGFLYQATVILDVLLAHFARQPDARARPEGADDLELAWTEGGVGQRCFAQIKKPREDDDGELKEEAWSLREIAQTLLPAAIRRLRGNTYRQRWILGDDVDADALAFVRAGVDAPTVAIAAYAHAIHLLARDESGVTKDLSKAERQSIGQWRYTPKENASPAECLTDMMAAFRARVTPLGAKDERIKAYEALVTEFDRVLPDVLSRVTIDSTFGLDEHVRSRVCDRVAETYAIVRERVVDTVFGNVRLFVDDIAVRKGTWIGPAELDAVVVRVWPEVMPLRAPPPLPTPHIDRPRLVQQIVGAKWTRAVEVVGEAGSGKTSLAREVYEHVQTSQPGIDIVYAEVRRTRTLREVLTALGLHLAKRGVSSLREQSQRAQISEEQRVAAIAHALGEVKERIFVLVDFVEGDCDDEFARLLAAFFRAEPPENCTFVLFGQRSILRGLMPLERATAGIAAAVEQKGFSFDEFSALVEHFHAGIDRERVRKVYERVVAGRVSGLIARLAYDLARSPSIEVMERIVAGPPKDIVSNAVHSRFDSIASSLRLAAEKLCCLMLPFLRSEAAEVFMTDPVEGAIDALLSQGLLQHHDEVRLEMHETVRRSLEERMPVAHRKGAHAALAAWYEARANLPAEILHLDRAGQTQEAHRKAHDAFLAGHDYALTGYVLENVLVTAKELVEALLRDPSPKFMHAIPELLSRLKDAGTADALLTGLRANPVRFGKDYRWAWAMVESILACEPHRLFDLAVFGLQQASGPSGDAARALERIAQGARRTKAKVDDRLLLLFDGRDERTKWAMIDVLLLDPHVEVLKRVLAFIEGRQPPQARGSYVMRSGPRIKLRLGTPEEVHAFLGAIPLVEPSAMTLSRSAELDDVSDLVWASRAALQPVCREILRSGTVDEVVTENALRVLILLQDETLLEATRAYRGQASRVGNLAALAPAFLPLSSSDVREVEARLFDLTRDINDRIGDFAVVFMVTADPEDVLRRLVAADASRESQWKFLALIQSVLRPAEYMVPLLDATLAGMGAHSPDLFAPYVAKLGELIGQPSLDLLLEYLSHSAGRVRLTAVLALQLRRSRQAAAPLSAMLAQESDSVVAHNGLIALLASGPTTADATHPSWALSSDAELWRLVLVGRLRNVADAPLLVAVAVDPTRAWALRRAAILAASRLPYAAALAMIEGQVLAERSPFQLDRSHNLVGHGALTEILGHEPDAETEALLRRAGAARVWATWFDEILEQALSSKGCPDGRTSIAWAIAQLPSPPTLEALERLVHGLHVPMLQAAVLRGLRMAGKLARLDQIISSTDSEWLMIRACCEYGNARTIDAAAAAHLRTLIAGSRFPTSPFAANVVASLEMRATRAAAAPVASAPLAPDVLGVQDVETAVRAGKAPTRPFIVACATEAEASQLVALLAPANDYVARHISAEPGLALVEGGARLVGPQVEYRDNHAGVRSALRPAVAVANRFGVANLWHEPAISQEPYLTAFFEQLALAGDATRFYGELEQRPDAFQLLFASIDRVRRVQNVLDIRIVPLLYRHAKAGSDDFLEGLCEVARLIDAPSIDPVLETLFTRWRQRFDLKKKTPQHQHKISLWRAFGSLSRHPRFRSIRDYDLRIAELLSLPMNWIHRRELVDVIARSPRAYVRIELLLAKDASFDHGLSEDVDHLDAVADHLFTMTNP